MTNLDLPVTEGLPAGTRKVKAPTTIVGVYRDREWYAPSEEMRLYLVRSFDEHIEGLEQEPGLPASLLYGQAVMLEDYLAIRRSQRDRVVARLGRQIATVQLKPPAGGASAS